MDRPHRVIKLLQSVWNLPNTALGLLLGFAGGWAVPRRDGDTLAFRVRRGPVETVCRRLGIAAFTVGDCVLYRADPTRALRAHEHRHVTQYRRLGPFFLPVYFMLLAVRGYANHPLELDARNNPEPVGAVATGGGHGDDDAPAAQLRPAGRRAGRGPHAGRGRNTSPNRPGPSR